MIVDSRLLLSIRFGDEAKELLKGEGLDAWWPLFLLLPFLLVHLLKLLPELLLHPLQGGHLLLYLAFLLLHLLVEGVLFAVQVLQRVGMK